jgi:hypothetical protein
MVGFGFGGSGRTYVRNIQRTADSVRPGRQRRRYGGKRWNIHLRAKKRRARLEDERTGTIVLVTTLIVVFAVLAAIILR